MLGSPAPGTGLSKGQAPFLELGVGAMRWWCGALGVGSPEHGPTFPSPSLGIWGLDFAGRGSLRSQSGKGGVRAGFSLGSQGGERKKRGVLPPVCEPHPAGETAGLGSELALPLTGFVTLVLAPLSPFSTCEREATPFPATWACGQHWARSSMSSACSFTPSVMSTVTAGGKDTSLPPPRARAHSSCRSHRRCLRGRRAHLPCPKGRLRSEGAAGSGGQYRATRATLASGRSQASFLKPQQVPRFMEGTLLLCRLGERRWAWWHSGRGALTSVDHAFVLSGLPRWGRMLPEVCLCLEQPCA